MRQTLRVVQTERFQEWFGRLRDRQARARILARLDSVGMGNPGDHKLLGSVFELRFAFGPGYRVCFVRRGEDLIILMGGGDKSTQDRDIKAVLQLAKEI